VVTRLRWLAPALLALLLPAVAPAKDIVGQAAVATTSIAATPAEVYQALTEALSTWRMRKTSLEEGIVKTDWVPRPKGREMYRGRIVAEFAAEGYQTHLTVRHEKQRKMTEARPTVGGPAAEWKDWDGDHEIARDVVRSVEKALGHEEAARPLDSLAARPTGAVVTIERECIVPPDVARRITALKSQRRDVVRQIRDMDAEIVAAANAGRYEDVKAEVEKGKARRAGLEAQLLEIDKEILRLVLAD
jgi:hypothetical protein